MAQTKTDQLDAARRSIEAGFQVDPSEPWLWVAKARLLQAQRLPQLALASLGFALAIWEDADETYTYLDEALALAKELQAVGS
jgi:hypothetical protein